MATDLYHLPSRKKHPLYYQMIVEPIDLTMIENKILSGEYHSIDMFERDVMKLFQNVEVCNNYFKATIPDFFPCNYAPLRRRGGILFC